jgi:hypothetical protein
MKPTDSGTANRDAQQRTNNQQQTPVQGPEAASKRDVEEAERKADEADQRAGEAKRMAVEQTEAVRQDLEDLAEDVADLDEALTEVLAVVDQLDTNVEEVVDNTGAMSPPKRRNMEDYGSLAERLKERLPDATGGVNFLHQAEEGITSARQERRENEEDEEEEVGTVVPIPFGDEDDQDGE